MYKGRDYPTSTGTYAVSEVIQDRIVFKGNGETLRIFIDADTTNFQLQESIDGVDYKVNGATPAAYAGTWKVISITDFTDGNFPLGTILRVVATGAIVVDRLFVVQDW